jgi:hypothetical protein
MFGTRGVPNHSILPSPPPQPPQPIVVAYRRRRSHVPDYFLRGIRPLRQLLGNNGNGGLLLSKAPSTGNLEDLQLITTTTTTETQNNSEDEREPLQLG